MRVHEGRQRDSSLHFLQSHGFIRQTKTSVPAVVPTFATSTSPRAGTSMGATVALAKTVTAKEAPTKFAKVSINKIIRF